ncbi:serine O-acetyltransferase EpsC [Pinibacter soli]|uniref:Serine acetyltransferase n=1 Tax=Pinibacter soli TaxID=3044211 RepID=A0ABT6RJ52_9BACT|nr:serine O-acetyltransferase EpsC [Pinibacter soli]MDI3322593.1 serine acetyltransferase [Pinibacter soli]
MANQYPGYILSKNIPQKEAVIKFAQDVINYLFPIVENEQAFLNKHQRKAEALKNGLLDILYSFDEKSKYYEANICDPFFSSLNEIKEELVIDANALLEFDPAAKSIDEVIITYPGFLAVAAYRIANKLCSLKLPIVPRIITEWAHSVTGIDIHPGATIGVPFIIDHGTGVVIGETTVIGKNVKLYQGVTLGALAVKKETTGQRHPTIEDGVIIYANSTILGGETVIGRDSIVGGNCFVTYSIPAHSIAYHQPVVTVKDKRDYNEPLNWVI